MTKSASVKDGEKLSDVKSTLTAIENGLLGRKVERQDAELDSALDVINKAVEVGAISVDGCDGEPGEGDEIGSGSGDENGSVEEPEGEEPAE